MSAIQHRNYTAANRTAYSLPHDEEERQRLNRQNNLFRNIFDDKILHAPVKLSDQDWVLETGSGTVVWLEGLARETSTKPLFIGTDIEPKLFPEPSSLPSNVSFQVQFTVVNQRLLVAGLRVHEWPRAISELYGVTKPGGWVQVLEPNVWTSGPAFTKFTELLFRLADYNGTMWRNIGQCMPGLLEQSGFVDVLRNPRATVCGTWAGPHGIEGKENMIGVIRGLKSPFLEGGGYGIVNSEAEFDGLVEQIEKEFDARPGSPIVWTMFLARKPMEC